MHDKSGQPSRLLWLQSPRAFLSDKTEKNQEKNKILLHLPYQGVGGLGGHGGSPVAWYEPWRILTRHSVKSVMQLAFVLSDIQ